MDCHLSVCINVISKPLGNLTFLVPQFLPNTEMGMKKGAKEMYNHDIPSLHFATY